MVVLNPIILMISLNCIAWYSPMIFPKPIMTSVCTHETHGLASKYPCCGNDNNHAVGAPYTPYVPRS